MAVLLAPRRSPRANTATCCSWKRVLRVSWALSLLLLANGASAFLPLPITAPSTTIKTNNGPATTARNHPRATVPLQGQLSGDDEGDDQLFRGGPESSQMPDFIRQFLDQTKGSDDDDAEAAAPYNDSNDLANTASHLIAIPVDACHELTLELESVQRAILYHCPVLVHACIAPAVTRLPLLHVQTTTAATSTRTGDTEATYLLQEMVRETVQEFLQMANDEQEDGNDNNDSNEADEQQQPPSNNNKDPEYYSALDDVTRADGDENNNNDDNDDEDQDLTTANEQGVQPWLVPFSGLGIDGPNNDVLYTTAVPTATGTRRLQDFCTALQTRIHQRTGWSTQFVHTATVDANDSEQQKEPDFRLAFMRLPGDWQDIVRREYDAARKNDDDENNPDDFFMDGDGVPMLTSDQGGNGISPIFWGQWMDDQFGQGDTRLREIAIYRRRQAITTTTGSDEENGDDDDDTAAQRQRRKYLNQNPEWVFYLPERTVPLPAGNAALSKLEASFENYQEKRMMDAEEALEAEKTSGAELPSNAKEEEEEDLLLAKTRERLEAVYAQQEDEFNAKITPDDDVETDEDVSAANISSTDDDDDDDDDDFDWRTGITERPADPNALDDWTRQRIQEAVASRARLQSLKELERKKDKPPIAENPVFQKYKDGTLVPKSEQPAATRELPPFPSREHCTGFWRVVSSPTGFTVEEGDQSRSDNLVLRVDGTTAGGPILDQETRQKASGGTWRLMTNADNDGSSEKRDARLRIRLVIPPKKERILVMEGKLEKVSMSADLPLASSTFQIPALEERAAKGSTEIEDLLYCSGNVWIEDARTARNRDEIGKFSLMKLNVPTDPSQFTITIPRPVRNQD